MPLATTLVRSALLLALSCSTFGCDGSNPIGTAATGSGASVSYAKLYTLGKKFRYHSTTSLGTYTSEATMEMEVTAVKDNIATLTMTTEVAGNKTTTSLPFDTSKPDPFAQLPLAQGNGAAGTGEYVRSRETVTVAAGTFDCTKVQSVSPASGPNGQGSTSVTIWASEKVGMVKEELSMSFAAAAGADPANALPSTKSTTELTSYQ